jgi:branched-subunit amino acid ABC-type transport system permease component
MQEMGKALVAIGVLLVIVGAVLYLSGKTNLPIGRLPGDITYRKGNFTFYAPLATSILLSIILSLILWFLNRR